MVADGDVMNSGEKYLRTSEAYIGPKTMLYIINVITSRDRKAGINVNVSVCLCVNK